jgi:ketosteroid isomerase-like protein
MGPLELARRYVDALNRGDREEAASLLTADAEVVLPGGTLHGREAFLQHGAGAGDAPTREAFEVEEVAEGEELVLRGRYVMRWADSGEVAQELPAAVSFDVEGDLIARVVFAPRPS